MVPWQSTACPALLTHASAPSGTRSVPKTASLFKYMRALAEREPAAKDRLLDVSGGGQPRSPGGTPAALAAACGLPDSRSAQSPHLPPPAASRKREAACACGPSMRAIPALADPALQVCSWICSDPDR